MNILSSFIELLLELINKYMKYHEKKKYTNGRSHLSTDATSMLLSKLRAQSNDELANSSKRGDSSENPIIANSTVKQNSDS